ncbi:putative alpha/beta-fold hydrolase [Methylohalomonas lacus]|uniref:Alpha/beta-fold hydrolase n=1 Tax=Methylohalomonas lacus TaxID=398773 RepID=A0AAE3HJS8_9GAMM|nr:hydrolase [Methylohalomonas lacus]MCS3902416.1 putative alpha/beta-fold hydrolase [Methylohalomonas lacus]
MTDPQHPTAAGQAPDSDAEAFCPAWWLPGPHLQTLWPFFFHRVSVAVDWQRLELPDGDFLDLAWHGPADSQRLCLLLHGLEGCYRSHYLPGLMQRLAAAGWRVVVMHFRGCSGPANRLTRSYHSGETGDLAQVINHLHEHEQPGILTAVGFSLGGNVLLKYLGERGAANRASGLAGACAVSVPFDLAVGAARLNRGLSRLYQWWLVATLRRKMRQKFAHRAAPFDLGQLHRQRSFRAFDGYVTAPLHGFRDADDYYRRSSSKAFLHNIQTPTLLLQAADDPFLGRDGLPAAGELSAQVRFELSSHGGHVGFIGGRLPWRPDYWLERRIPRFLATVQPPATVAVTAGSMSHEPV